MIDLNDGQLVHVAACIAAGYASSHEDGAVDAFYKALEKLIESNGQEHEDNSQEHEEDEMKMNL